MSKDQKDKEPQEEVKTEPQAESTKGKYVKLEKDGNVKLQDNPERVKELQTLGWKVVK